MANEVNVGKLVAEIILESKTDGADEAISKIKEVNTAAGDGKIELAVDVKNTDDLNYIRDVLDTIGINGTEAEKILSSAFANTSGLSQYKEKLEQISAKIDEQREKIKTLQEWTSSTVTADNSYEHSSDKQQTMPKSKNSKVRESFESIGLNTIDTRENGGKLWVIGDRADIEEYVKAAVSRKPCSRL